MALYFNSSSTLAFQISCSEILNPPIPMEEEWLDFLCLWGKCSIAVLAYLSRYVLLHVTGHTSYAFHPSLRTLEEVYCGPIVAY